LSKPILPEYPRNVTDQLFPQLLEAKDALGILLTEGLDALLFLKMLLVFKPEGEKTHWSKAGLHHIF
jgi:hypothetical protein